MGLTVAAYLALEPSTARDGSFMMMARKRKNCGTLFMLLVRKSAMLSCVRTKGTSILGA